MAKHELDLLHVKNPTNKSYSVTWGGVPYTLNPGQEIIWHRFIAEHYAKHLTNAILLLKEKEHKDNYIAKGGDLSKYQPVAYLNSRKLRPDVLNSILTGVYQYHKPQSNDPNTILQQQLDQVNARQSNEPEPLDLGTQNDDRTGDMTATEFDAPDDLPAGPTAPSESQEPIVDPAVSELPVAMNTPTIPPMTSPQDTSGESVDQKRPQLLAEAKKLGITVPFGSKNDDIKALIQKHYA